MYKYTFTLFSYKLRSVITNYYIEKSRYAATNHLHDTIYCIRVFQNCDLVLLDNSPDGPAAKIGIQGLEPNMSSISDPFRVHDIITVINGAPIKNSSDFYNYIHNKSVGDKVVLTTMHDRVKRNFTVTLGEMPGPLL